MTRILIADDHPLVLRGVEGLFDPTRYRVVATCTNGTDAWAHISSSTCDIAVIDLDIPGLSGLDILREVRKASLDVKIVLLTASINDADLVEAINCGVDGLVLKETAAYLLVTCVDAIRDGSSWIDRSAMSRALRMLSTARSQPERASLTNREAEVARLVAAGLRNKDIAHRTNITEGTVKMHLHNIYEKLGIGTRTELAIHVHDLGLKP